VVEPLFALFTSLGTCVLLSAAAQPSAGTWKEFAWKPGHFRVLLPGTPEEQKESLKTPSGPIQILMFLLEPKKGAGTYAVGYSIAPHSLLTGANTEKGLEHARDSAVARAKGKLRSDRRIRLHGYPGREFEIEVEGKLRIRSRLVVVKNRLYQLLVIGPPEWLRSRDPARFLDSFELRE
jgi:hypothetical protein